MKPPRLATALLSVTVPPSDRDMVLGDLEEAFHARVRRGAVLCRSWYWSQAVFMAVAYSAHRAGGALRRRGRHADAPARTGRAGVARSGGPGAEAWIREVRVAARTLLRRPALAAIGIGTLALGIGANAAIFAVIHGSLLRPLPFPDSEALVWLASWHKDQPRGGGNLSPANFLDARAAMGSLMTMAAYEIESANFATAEAPLRIRGATVSPGFLEVLGVRPRLGRSFDPRDGHRDAPGTLVLTERLWRERFGSDPDVVGRVVQINAEAHTVLGVLPAEFSFLGEPRFLRPFRWGGTEAQRADRRINAIGRLAPGVDLRTGWEELRSVYARLEAEHPAENANWTVWMEPLHGRTVSGAQGSLRLLGGAVALVLLIACVNVANLLLVRAESRRRELALRFALGAGRRGLLPTFVSEGLLLALVGGGLGLLAAPSLVRVLVAVYGDQLPRADQIAVSPETLVFGLAVVLSTGVLVGLAPLLRSGDPYEHRPSRKRTRGVRSPVKRMLVALEVALAVTLVAGSGLLIRSLWKLNQVDSGVRAPEQVLTFRVTLSGPRYRERASVVDFYDRVEDALERLPGVEWVGWDSRTPLVGGSNLVQVSRTDAPDRIARFVEHRWVTAALFPAVGIPLLEGRVWTASEMRDTIDAGVRVILSETLARRLYPDGSAVGGRIDAGMNDDGYAVIGVVGDVRELGPDRPAPPMLYFPHPGPPAASGLLGAVRTSGDPLTLAPQLRAAVGRVDPDIPLYAVRLLSDVAAQRLGSRRVSTSLLASFAILAVVLGGIGIYGVLSFTMTQRAREMGVRIALGASRHAVRRLVLVQAMGLALPGLAVGTAAALVSGRLLESMLFEVHAADPFTYVAVALVVAAVCALAAVVPARRATRIDPMINLRAE